MKRVLTAVTALLLFAAPGFSQTAHKHHIVIEMSLAGVDAWKHVAGHINVLRNAFANDVDIEVVALGEGLAMLQKTNTELEASLRKAVESGVVLSACQNSMKLRKVKSEDLFPFAKEVPSGLAEVVIKQEAGYSYIKASI